MFNLQNIRKLALILALVLLSGNVGYRLGQKQVQFTLTKEKKIVINASPPPNRNVDFSLFWAVWSRLGQRY